MKKDGFRYDRTLKFDNVTVNVYRPIISDEENERRMKRIHDAAAELLKEQIRNNPKPAK